MTTRTLENLTKLHRRLLDQKRQEMAILEGKREELFKRREHLSHELEAERKLAEKSPDIQFSFGAYALRIQQLQQNISHKILKYDEAIETLAEAIREAFQEVKTYEIMWERARDEERKALIKREQDELDEIGGNNYIYNQQPSDS